MIRGGYAMKKNIVMEDEKDMHFKVREDAVTSTAAKVVGGQKLIHDPYRKKSAKLDKWIKEHAK